MRIRTFAPLATVLLVNRAAGSCAICVSFSTEAATVVDVVGATVDVVELDVDEDDVVEDELVELELVGVVVLELELELELVDCAGAAMVNVNVCTAAR